MNIFHHTKFKLAYEENVQRIAFALSLAGFYIKISKENGSFALDVYSLGPNK